MSWLTGRASAIVMLVVSAALILWVIPANTDPGYGGSLQPATVPTIAAALMGMGALLSLFEPGARDRPDGALFRRTAVFFGLIVLSIAVTRFAGFVWVAIPLCLSVMLVSGERRVVWLIAGALGIPFAVWLIFAVGLGRPLP